MAGIGIITNPNSKRNKESPGHKHMLGYILGKRGVYKITESLEHLSEVAEEFKRLQIEILGISGGDGTVQKTLTAFINVYGDYPLPKIALLRGGTINVIAQNLGIRGSSRTLLLDLVERYHSGHQFRERSFYTLKCNNDYGFIFCSGFGSNFLNAYYENKTNALGAAIFTLKTIFSAIRNKGIIEKLYRTFSVIIKNGRNEHLLQSRSTMLIASTLPKMPLAFKLCNRLSANAPFFQLFNFNLSPFRLAIESTRIFLRLGFKSTHVREWLSDDVTIVGDPAPLYSIDGDIYDHHPEVHLKLGPKLVFIY